MLVVDLVRGRCGCGVAKVSHDAHTCDVVSRINTKILWLVVFFDDPIVDSCNCLDEISQSPSVVGRCLIYKFVVDEWPYPLVLMHV